MIALLLAQAAVSVAAPPLTPSPPVIVTRSAFSPGITRPRFRVAITVRAAEGVLWSGSLWVSSRAGGASWRQNMQEAQPDECATPITYGVNAQSELSVQVNPMSSADTSAREQVTVNVRWTRPAPTPCGGSRTVELRQTIALDSREPAVVRGDGGLLVELRRN